MSSILTSKTLLDFDSEPFEEPEAYKLKMGTIQLLSEKLHYMLYDSRNGQIRAKGKFPENHPEDALPINGVYTYWWTYYSDEATILFYSHSRKGLYTFDLTKPDSQPTRWSSAENYTVNPDQMHTFIWLTYNESTDTATLIHHVDENKIKADLIKKDGHAQTIVEQDVKNINWILKEGERCIIGCNTDGRNFPLYMITENGLKTLTFDTQKDVTFIEFGFLKDNLMFMLFNEGEQSTVGCYLIQLGSIDLNQDVKISADDDYVQVVTLHAQDDESIMADSYVLVNRVMSTITIATVCNRLVTYRFGLSEEGKYVTTEEMQDSSGLELQSIATNFSLDKETLISCELDENNDKKVHIATHSLTDLSCFYLWLLQNISGVSDVWNPADLGAITKLLVD